jgi:hypothetical protein
VTWDIVRLVLIAASGLLLVAVALSVGFVAFVQEGIPGECDSVEALEAAGIGYRDEDVEEFNGVPYVCAEL